MSAPRPIILSPRARADLRETFAFIAGRATPDVAEDYLDRLERALKTLETFPDAGAPLRRGIRRFGFERRMTVLYRVRQRDVQIVRVLYGGRDSPLNSTR